MVVLAAAAMLTTVLFAGCPSPYSSPNWPYGSGGGGEGGNSAGASTLSVDVTPPGVVTNLAAHTGAGGSVFFSWLDPEDSDFDHVEIWVSESETDTSGASLASVSKGKMNYADSGTPNAVLYYHFISVDKSGNRSAAVNYMVILSPASVKVTGLMGTVGKDFSPGSGSVTLTWTDPVSPTFTRVEITHNQGGAQAKQVKKGAQSYTWTGLSVGPQYTFSVKAVDSVAATENVPITMKLTPDETAPGPVAGLIAYSGFGSVKLEWTAPGDADTQYVEISCDPVSGPVQTVNAAPGAGGTYTWNGLAGGVTYTFTVKAVDDSGNRSAGVSVSGTIMDVTPPGPVTGLVGLYGDEYAAFIWADPGDADLDYIEIDYGMAPQQAGKGNGTYTWNYLDNGTAYTFTVKAVDAAGNRSAPVTVGPVTPHPIAYSAEDFGGPAVGVFTVYDKPTWEAALAAIKRNGNDKNYGVDVTAVVTGLGAGNFGSLTGVTVSLRGAGNSLALGSAGTLIAVGANQTLVLRELTLKGMDNRYSASSSYSFVAVNTGGHLILETGAVITGCYETFGLTIAGGDVTMNGGEIISNKGTFGGPGSGGVTMSNGSLTLNSGKINSNTFDDGRGGGVTMSGGTFTMNGGEIRGNYGRDGGGGVYISGGAFTMWGGLITGNSIQFNSGTNFQKGGGTAQWNQNKDGVLVDLATTNGAINLQ
jgi:hypothetical protein